MEKMVNLSEWKMKTIENALRLTHRINNCSSKETAFDREVVKAYEYAKEALSSSETMTSNMDASHCIDSHEGVMVIGAKEYKIREVIEDLQETDRGIIIVSGTGERTEYGKERFKDRRSDNGNLTSTESLHILDSIPFDKEYHSFEEDKVPSPIYHPKRKKFKRK